MKNRKAVWSWALLDWGNSAFSLTVMTAFFPLFFAEYWCDAPGMTPERGTQYLAWANSLHALVIAILAPILGAVADQGSRKKRFLLGFTVLGVLSTLLLPLVPRGGYILAPVLYSIAALGFSGNSTFYDTLLTDVADADSYDRVSAFGFSLGYLGSEVLFLLNSAMALRPDLFGLADAQAAIKVSFVLTAAWWAVFTIPALLWVEERPSAAPPSAAGGTLAQGLRQFAATFRELRRYKAAVLFLASYILYIDGVNTVITMSVDFGKKIGIDSMGMVLALHLTQLVAFPAAIVYGRVGEQVGARRAILAGILVYAGICFWAYFMRTRNEFIAMAIMIGLVQGGVQSLSRSYFARLIPAEKSGEFFGFYNMMGKFAAVLGPLLMGLAVPWVGVRASILSLLILFAGGAAVLWFVPEQTEAARDAG